MIGVEELLSLLLSEVEPLPGISLPIAEPIGASLAGPLVAVDPIPPFANSAMDGYAVRRADLSTVDRFVVAADLPAGQPATRHLEFGQTAAIATGAALPHGADGVVPVEQAEREGDLVRLAGPIPDHGHVRPAGEDIAPGRVLAPSGSLLTGPLATLAAAAGISHATVVSIPRVGILTTGDELIPVYATLAAASVRDVNGPLIAHAVESIGLVAVNLGRAGDDAEDITNRLVSSTTVDAIVVSGGLGRGDRDVVVEALARHGLVRAFEVAMRPGKPFAFGRSDGRPVYALPGNPGAAIAAFHALVAPALRVLSGRQAHGPGIRAVLTSPLANPSGRRHYVRATLAWDGPTLAATPTGRQGSGLVSDIVAADALVVIPETVVRAEPGDVYQIIPLKPIGGS